MDDQRNRDHTLPESEPSPTKKDLRIRLKVLQKGNEFSGEESVHNQNPGKKNRLCNVCNKSFSSGRALGGHMRVHTQAQDEGILNKNQNPKLKAHHPKPKNQLCYLSAPANCGSYKTSNATDGSIKGDPKTNGNTTCSLCGKDFPSMKSLFGHMRCHPEREWRGIQPPPAAAAKHSSSSTVSDSVGRKMDDQIDSPMTTGRSAFNLAESLSSWSVTGKRGLKSMATVASKEPIPDAVYDLLMLAHGNSLKSVMLNKQRSEQSEAINRDFPEQVKIEDRDPVSERPQNRVFLSKKMKLDERKSQKRRNEEPEIRNIDFTSKKANADKRNDVSRTEFDTEPVNMNSTLEYTDEFGEDSKQSSEEESDSKTADYTVQGKQFTRMSEISNKMMKKKTKKMKLRDLGKVGDFDLNDYKQRPTTFSDKYKCSICNKSFSSHQALGGHRSGHKKGKNSPAIADMDESAFVDASAEEEQYGVAVNLSQVDGFPEFDGIGSRVASTHRCKICNRTFPTGQALGGHKRCHWTGPVEAPPSSVASPEEVSKVWRGMLEIDLNELPVMEDEEGLESASTQSIGIRQPIDHASSSYNSVA